MPKHKLPYKTDLTAMAKARRNTRTELRLPGELLRYAHQAAERAGVGWGEWCRTAIIDAVSQSAVSERDRLTREDRGPVFVNDNDLTPYEQHLAGIEKEEPDQ